MADMVHPLYTREDVDALRERSREIRDRSQAACRTARALLTRIERSERRRRERAVASRLGRKK